MLRATSAASSRLILASSLTCGMVDRYAPFNEPGLNRSRPPIGGHSAHLIQIRAFISTARFDTWPRVPLLLSTLGMLELAELRWSRGTAFDRVADRHDNFSCNGAHMQRRRTGLSDLFLNQRGAMGDNSRRRSPDAAGPGRSSDLEGAVARGSIGIPNSNGTCMGLPTMRFRPSGRNKGRLASPKVAFVAPGATALGFLPQLPGLPARRECARAPDRTRPRSGTARPQQRR